MSGSQAGAPITYRAAIEGDHVAIVEIVDEWAGGRRVHDALPRLWLRHFASTSLIAETADGRLAGFLVGFVSTDRPTEAVIVCLAVSPSHRKRGIGRGLVERFGAAAAERGAREVVTSIWPGDPIGVAFHRAIGFEVDAGPGTQNRYGTPSYPDHDAEREDRAIMRLPIR
jgi:ribosomal protein S18 acetylase RimI-like enzyme